MASLLPLEFTDGTHIKIREESFAQTKEELQSLLEGERHLHTKAFAKDVMFSHEIKSNNLVEGYADDVELVKDVIKRRLENLSQSKKQRILNLYHGYNYILKNGDINPETLRKLYAILSKDLLVRYDQEHMGQYYRNAPVYIFNSIRIGAEPDMGVPEEQIDKFMNAYFDFLNNIDMSQSITDEYIKSQILHFYFVYIHPYFDVNGRTSRTVAMWYLLNKKAYPYIIFNRGINFKRTNYYNCIIDAKKYHDISFFIDYMLKTVQCELEKEYIMQNIAKNISRPLTSTDWQSMLYLLSMNGLVTVSDFASIYNRFNPNKKAKEIYETMIDPLKQMGILQVERLTSSNMFDNYPNEVIDFNPSVMDYDKEKIKRLVKYK